MQVKPKEVSADKATTPGQIDRPIATCSRGLFETWVLETEHPVIGWIGADWLDQGDAPNTYANDYIQGAWVMWQAVEAMKHVDAIRLDFMLEKHRKVVVELIPGNLHMVYVEEGFMGDVSYPSVFHEGGWSQSSDAARATKRNAIDIAIAASEKGGAA